MAEGTRLKALDESMKKMQEVTDNQSQRLDEVATKHTQRLYEQQRSMGELISKVTALDGKLEQTLRLLMEKSNNSQDGQPSTAPQTTSYHPQTDGQTERLNRTLDMYLRSFVMDSPKQWAKHLPWAEYWYNTAHHTATGMTPFLAVYGRSPPTLTNYLPYSTSNAALEHELQQRDHILAQLRRNLQTAQERMKQQADKKRSEKEFDVGKWVLVRLQPYRQLTVRGHGNQKLARKFFGPFRISARVGPVAYRLQLPDTVKIYNVFHISLLKKAIGVDNINTPQAIVPPYPTMPQLEPRLILSTRNIVQQGQTIPQVLVHWQNLPQEEATWVDFREFQTAYPSWNLEDKVLFDDGSNVMPNNADAVQSNVSPRLSEVQNNNKV